MSETLHIIDIATVQALSLNATPDGQQQVTAVVDALSRAFNSFVGYQLRESDYADVVVNGSGNGMLVLPHLYVTAVSKVEYRQSKTLWAELDDEYWELDDISHQGVVGYGGYVFTYGARNWRVTYKAGYTLENMPGGIVDAFFKEFNRWMERRWDIGSKSLAGSANTTTSYISHDVQRMLRPWMRVGV